MALELFVKISDAQFYFIIILHDLPAKNRLIHYKPSLNHYPIRPLVDNYTTITMSSPHPLASVVYYIHSIQEILFKYIGTRVWSIIAEYIT